MPKGSEELVNARREEIIKACASLYETMSFKDITIKEIGKETSFTRTSIYNYFQTKEEIFLALLEHEYECWIADLDTVIATHDEMSREQLAEELAHSIARRENLLKLLSMNLYDMEENSRMERLKEFKIAYGKSIAAVRNCLEKFCPEMSQQEHTEFIFAFFPFMYGIYPYTAVTQKQREAMDEADVEYIYLSIYEISYMAIMKLLGN